MHAKKGIKSYPSAKSLRAVFTILGLRNTVVKGAMLADEMGFGKMSRLPSCSIQSIPDILDVSEIQG